MYCTLNIVWVIKTRRMRWVGHAACMVPRRNACRALMGKAEGEKPLRRPRLRWEDNVKMDFKAVG